MEVTKWEVSPLDEIFGSTRERGEVLTPTCKNENHNLFWEQMGVGPTDSYTTVAEFLTVYPTRFRARHKGK